MGIERNKKAAALRYNPELENAPRILVKGEGWLAAQIVARAKEYDVPIQENANLAELLCETDINEIIPESLYETVASILAFIYNVNDEYPIERG